MGKMLSAKQLAAALGRSRFMIYRDVQAGLLPGRRVHPRGRLYFDPGEVQEQMRHAAELHQFAGEVLAGRHTPQAPAPAAL